MKNAPFSLDSWSHSKKSIKVATGLDTNDALNQGKTYLQKPEMASDKRKVKEARPFYEVPDHIRTSGRIVQEARNSMSTGVGGLRTIDTARPFTPRDDSRALFRRSSAREGRPPSAFSVSTLEFEASTSRPTSGSTPTTLEPLVDLHRPVIHPEVGLRVVSPPVHLLPRPPSGDPFSRPRPPSSSTNGGDPLSPLSPLQPIPPPTSSSSSGQKSLMKHKLERQRSRSINELAHPLPSCLTHHDTESEAGQRRVQSGPKERTTPEPDEENEKGSNKGARKNSVRSSTPSSPFKPSRATGVNNAAAASGANDDQLWSESISPLLDGLVKAKAAEDWAKCGHLAVELHDNLDSVNMFGRKSKPKYRAPVLKICFRLLDCGVAKAALPIIKCILKFKVGGNNMSNACRLLFKFAKNEANDDIFLQTDLLSALLETLTSTRLFSAEEGIVYAAGALKFLTSNPAIVKELANLDAIESMGKLLNECLEDAIEAKDDAKQTLATVSNALVQITSTVRNLSELPGSRVDFIKCDLLRSLVFFLRLFPRDTELALNICRILSKLTLAEEVTAHLLDYRRVGEKDEDELFSALFAVLTTHVQKADLVVRALFILGNLTAKSDDARMRLWRLKTGSGDNNGTSISATTFETGPVTVLVTTFLNYVDMMKRESHQELPGGERPDKSEDVLIKLVRIIANLSINEDIGDAIASDEIMIGLLVKVIELKGQSRDADPPNELLLNAVATINNLSYYMIEADDGDSDEATQSMLQLAQSLRPLAYSVNEECILEAARVFGNLSQIRQVRHFMVDNAMDKLLVALLDSTNRELVFTSVGILINLMVDRENRHIIKRENGVQKLIDVLRDFGQNDWHLASMVCQVFWNVSEQMNSSYDCFGNPEADDLCDVLTEFLDENVAIGSENSDDMDEETQRIVGNLWRRQFCPVAVRLLQRVESHLSDLEPIHSSADND